MLRHACPIIRGVVRDEQGTPVANAMVRKRKGAMADNPMLAMLMGPDTCTYTDADGSFVLEPVRPGKLQLHEHSALSAVMTLKEHEILETPPRRRRMVTLQLAPRHRQRADARCAPARLSK